TEKTSEPAPSKKKDDSGKRTRHEQKKRQKEEKKANKRPIRRIFPIWLRLIVIPILCIVALLLGMMVGYGVIGDGSPFDALHKETWQHIIDIVKSKENSLSIYSKSMRQGISTSKARFSFQGYHCETCFFIFSGILGMSQQIFLRIIS